MVPMITAADYQRAFLKERENEYPAIDAFEQAAGFAIDRARLEDAARVLACPVKVNPPNWQHGRVIYAAARKYLATTSGAVTFLDIGTAKGFSALCMAWALQDSEREGQIVSCDVLDPQRRDIRNTVAEVDGPKLLKEVLAPWPEASLVHFIKKTGADWLRQDDYRVNIAFIDGKHSYDAVSEEIGLLRVRQEPGDIALFDDVQIPGVGKAVTGISDYAVEHIAAKPDRRYALAVRL
jgi:predicted O-methyltransferase YrrM